MVEFLEADPSCLRKLIHNQKLGQDNLIAQKEPHISNLNEFFLYLFDKIDSKSDLLLELSIYIHKNPKISEKTKLRYFEKVIEGIESSNSPRILDLNNIFSLSVVLQKKIALKFIDKIFESEINGMSFYFLNLKNIMYN